MENADELLAELNYTFHPKINVDFYRRNLEEYIKDRENLIKFNDYLLNKSHLLEYRISVNERSYEIFQQEKLISKSTVLFKRIGWDLSLLNVYATPEPFISQSVNRMPEQKVLIIENKDTYITVSNLLNKGYKIFGEKVSTIIYGEGRKIESSFQELPKDTTLDFLMDNRNEFYYWGDIDKTGIKILYNLRKKTEWTEIKPFEPAYKKMINLSKEITLTKSPKEQVDEYEAGLNTITDTELRSDIREVIEDGKYIPQEIIRFYDMIEEE